MRPLFAFGALIGVAILIMALATLSRPNDGRTFAPKEEAESQSSAASQPPAPKPSAFNPERAQAFDKYKAGAVRATLSVENRGTLTLELYPKAAPKTVAHFVDLCKRHFYDGIKFHRVVPGFVAQAGDPNSKSVDGAELAATSPDDVPMKFGLGSGGSGKTVPLEAHLPHLPYTLGLARSQDPDTGDSQFYINLANNARLDSGYCVFGRIVAGEDIASKIQQGDRITRLSVP
ncbi:MAG TPA: peptidylprolyl isomerase [Chthonomonadaceae bacterium]|nr:peptidylprolyl isomerase [Chthonomonadaceae bacterium]